MKYEILKPIMLGFLTHNDSFDCIVGPGEAHLEFIDQDIILVNPKGERMTSHTQNHAIDIWLKDGSIKECT
jgi:hypothetical protein